MGFEGVSQISGQNQTPLPGPRLPAGWAWARDGDGQPYFYNRSLDVVTYDDPRGSVDVATAALSSSAFSDGYAEGAPAIRPVQLPAMPEKFSIKKIISDTLAEAASDASTDTSSTAARAAPPPATPPPPKPTDLLAPTPGMASPPSGPNLMDLLTPIRPAAMPTALPSAAPPASVPALTASLIDMEILE